MPLYQRFRDKALVKKLNTEILEKVVGIEVAVYKLSPSDTPDNIYGESSKKAYFNPVRVHALVRNESTLAVNNVSGDIEQNKNISVAMLRDELVEKDLALEISDIIFWDGGYYEIDNVRQSNHWWGRNPDESIGVVEGDVDSHGYTVSVIVEAHRTSMSNLNIVEVRSGTQEISTKAKNIYGE